MTLQEQKILDNKRLELLATATAKVYQVHVIIRACALLGVNGESSEVMLDLLRGATAAMQSLRDSLNGQQMPKEGESPV